MIWLPAFRGFAVALATSQARGLLVRRQEVENSTMILQAKVQQLRTKPVHH
jgi:hypothetical protein